jgi:hypothetical protein
MPLLKSESLTSEMSLGETVGGFQSREVSGKIIARPHGLENFTETQPPHLQNGEMPAALPGVVLSSNRCKVLSTGLDPIPTPYKLLE